MRIFENNFIKAMEHFFHVYIDPSKHSGEGGRGGGLGEFLKAMQTRDINKGLHNCLEFSQPCLCLDEAL